MTGVVSRRLQRHLQDEIRRADGTPRARRKASATPTPGKVRSVYFGHRQNTIVPLPKGDFFAGIKLTFNEPVGTDPPSPDSVRCCTKRHHQNRPLFSRRGSTGRPECNTAVSGGDIRVVFRVHHRRQPRGRRAATAADTLPSRPRRLPQRPSLRDEQLCLRTGSCITSPSGDRSMPSTTSASFFVSRINISHTHSTYSRAADR